MTVVMQVKGAPNATERVSRGVVFIHSCPRAVAAHVEWALGKVAGATVGIDWADQPVAPGQVRAELIWSGPPGTGATLASALHAFRQMRYEVTEDPSPGREGERFSATPTLGLFRASIGVHGDVMVPEDRLKTALVQAALTGDPLGEEIARLIGQPWDDELEPFRHAGDGAPVRWLHRVG